MKTIANFLTTHPHVGTWIVWIFGIIYVATATLAGAVMLLQAFGKLEGLCHKLGIKYK